MLGEMASKYLKKKNKKNKITQKIQLDKTRHSSFIC